MREKNFSTHRKREPVQQRGRRSKENLIAMARELIDREGYDQITAYKISQAADTSVGTFYAYFTDKQDIFRSIVEDYSEKQYQKFSNDARKILARNLDFENSLNELLHRFYEMHKAEPRLHEEIIIRSHKDPAVLGILEKNDQRIVEELLNFLSHFIAQAAWDAADIYLIQTTLKLDIHEMMFTPARVPVEKVLQKLARMIYLFIEDISKTMG